MTNVLFAPLGLIRAALCPLDFSAMKCSDLPQLVNLISLAPAIGNLEVGECLRHESVFPYIDRNKNRKLGCQIVTAPLGLAPQDIDILFGIYTFAHQLDQTEGLSDDLRITMTVNQLARQAGLSLNGHKDTRRLQSRVFRLSYMKLSSTAVWVSGKRAYESLENTSFFDIDNMTLLTEPWRPFTLQLSHKFVALMRSTPRVAFDVAAFRSHKSPAKRRLYTLVAREGWVYRDSQTYAADDFAIHQIGYTRHTDDSTDTNRRRRRLHDLRSLLRDFEERDLIRPYSPWKGYFATLNRGPLAGQLCLRWSRGPAIRSRETSKGDVALVPEQDPLYDQIATLKDHEGNPLCVPAFRHLLSEHGRDRLQRHLTITLAQKECMPNSFTRSEVAAFVDRVQKNHPAPDWYSDQLKKERNEFDGTNASAELEKVYQSMTLNV